MSHIVHEAIVVTLAGAMPSEGIKCGELIDFAKSRGLAVVGPAFSQVNGYLSFMIVPDGSSEGWEERTKADAAREEFLDWIREDPLVEYAHVRYGRDYEARPRVVEGTNDDHSRPERELENWEITSKKMGDDVAVYLRWNGSAGGHFGAFAFELCRVPWEPWNSDYPLDSILNGFKKAVRGELSRTQEE